MRSQKARLRGVREEPAKPANGKVIRLSATPRVKVQAEALERKGILLGPGKGAAHKAYRAHSALKTITLNFNAQHDIRSVMVTSPTPGVGKTVTAINLGIQIARHSNRTALLLDLNFRRPAIHRFFGHRPRAGIADCLKDGIAFRDILFAPVDRLIVAPSGCSQGDPTELISSPMLAELIDETVARYKERLIILDMPSVLECDDVPALAPKVDANLLVVEAGKSRHCELEETLESLSGTRTLGVVLNRVSAGA